MIYDINTNRWMDTFENSENSTSSVISLAFSENGRYLLSCSSDRFIRLWDIENNWTMLSQRQLVHANSLTFSPNNTSFIARRDNSFFVINIRNGQIIQDISGSGIREVFYNRNSELVIVGINNQSVQIW